MSDRIFVTRTEQQMQKDLVGKTVQIYVDNDKPLFPEPRKVLDVVKVPWGFRIRIEYPGTKEWSTLRNNDSYEIS